ncbi:MAG: TraR/DksA family transcriptional regulator [Actinobacteria bacterium]|nr:TraR/DksA family transcriptional regulator [Actinomycetota bacterium]MCA1721534.1 TraR/DksA family transcriptional regulator [Actinomycetota bacterium]
MQDERLSTERAATVAQLTGLRRDFAGMVDASEASNADDEHDPEGATIGFERAQLAVLIAQAEQRLADLDGALEQVRAGSYGTCAVCGGPIAAARLEARPQARTCIGCAS